MSEDIPARLEYLRGEIQAERISYSEISELQALAAHIPAWDTELLEWAGVPEFPEDAPAYAVGQTVKLLNVPEYGGWATGYIETASCGVYGVRVQGLKLHTVTAQHLERLDGLTAEWRRVPLAPCPGCQKLMPAGQTSCNACSTEDGPVIKGGA